MKPVLSASGKSILGKLTRLVSANHGSSFRINTIYMLRANIIAQLVVLLITPLLSRLYTSHDFGQFAFFYAIVGLAVSVTTCRFDWSIPNAKYAGGAVALFQIGLIFTIITSLSTTLLIAIAHFVKYTPFIESDIGIIAFYIPLAMVGFGVIELFNALYIRIGSLKLVGTVKIYQSLSNSLISLLCGIAKFGFIGLISSLLISVWLAAVVFINDKRENKYKIIYASKVRISAMFQRFKSEAALSTAVSVTNALSFSATIFLIANYFTMQELGWYALMQRLALAPVGLISSSIGKSFWTKAASLARIKAFAELRVLYIRTTYRLCLFIIPIVIGCISAPFVIGPLLGSSEWEPAGLILLAMAPQIIGVIIFSPTNHLIVYGRQLYQLASDFFTILLTTIVIIITVKMNFGIVACTAGISFSILLGYIIRFNLHLYANKILKNAK